MGALVRKAEQRLFTRWQANGRPFVGDGVVDEVAYLASRPRLLFVLKEVNSPDNSDWDLRTFIADGARSQTWNNVTRWVRGIRALPEELSWEDLALVTQDQRREVLRSIVAVNLKKEPGGHTTKNETLSEAVHRDAPLIREQLELYQPDLTIACGSITASLLGEVMSLPHPWATTKRGIPFARSDALGTVISYSHPGARVNDALLHYGLVDAIRELLHGIDLRRVASRRAE
jgi:hypothetical protein